MHVHRTCALVKYGASKYLSGLACMQADWNLGKLSASRFWVLNTQKSNEDMPNMLPIAYLNHNLRYCNEKLAWDNLDPLTHSYIFWFTTKGEKVVNTSFYIIFM